MKYVRLILLLLIVASCDSPVAGVSEEIASQFQSSGRTFVNLAKVVTKDWDKVCILGPYSTSKHVYDMLGFAWPVEMRSIIEITPDWEKAA